MKKNNFGIVLVGHGSGIATANEAVVKLKDKVARATGFKVESAFLQLAKPTIEEATALLISDGCKKLIFLPYFLYKGQHVLSDLPKIISGLAQKWPLIDFHITQPVGDDSRLAHILIDHALGACGWNLKDNHHVELQSWSEFLTKDNVFSESLRGQEIEQVSLNIVENLAVLPLAKLERQVAARVVHATGDLFLANQLLFSPNFFSQALNYLNKSNVVIVTDVKMTAAAISKRLLPPATKVICGLDFSEGQQQQQPYKTRCQVGIKQALINFPQAAVVVGNAPTALEQVLEMVKENLIQPAFIIGVPVGFVGAHQAKEKLSQTNLAFVTLLGTRGGSPVAGAILNALLKIKSQRCKFSQEENK